jgi:hypothetical protein
MHFYRICMGHSYRKRGNGGKWQEIIYNITTCIACSKNIFYFYKQLRLVFYAYYVLYLSSSIMYINISKDLVIPIISAEYISQYDKRMVIIWVRRESRRRSPPPPL